MDKLELLQIIQRTIDNEATDLNLAGSGISELPPEIGQIKSLLKLDLESVS
jgi:hypothetical protein